MQGRANNVLAKVLLVVGVHNYSNPAYYQIIEMLERGKGTIIFKINGHFIIEFIVDLWWNCSTYKVLEESFFCMIVLT